MDESKVLFYMELLLNLLDAVEGMDTIKQQENKDVCVGYLLKVQTVLKSFLQRLVSNDYLSAAKSRESLFDSLASPLCFFNEFVDVPILSDVQYS